MGIKIILNAIVKDELKAKVLFRGLDNAKHIFTHVAILDTGSTDGSVEALQKWMKENGKEGLVEVKMWDDNFGKSRTAAIELAYKVMKKCDPMGKHTFYAMFHDADNEIWSNEQKLTPITDEMRASAYTLPWSKKMTKALKADKISINMRTGPHVYKYAWMVCLGTSVKTHAWQWLCARHEYVDDMGTGKAGNTQFIDTGYIHSGRDGARGKVETSKYWTDAAAIEKELKDLASKAPKPRNIYYLANSYKDMQWWAKAAENYQKRIYMSDFQEEIFHSLISLSDMNAIMQKPESEILEPIYKAMALFPHRLEAVNKLVTYLLSKEAGKERFHEAWIAGKSFINTPFPKNDLLFVEEKLYQYEFSLKMLVACYYSGIYYLNPNLADGKFSDFEPLKCHQESRMIAQIHAEPYKKIVNDLMKNDFLDKKLLVPYVRDTAGIWNEKEKAILYNILDPKYGETIASAKNGEKIALASSKSDKNQAKSGTQDKSNTFTPSTHFASNDILTPIKNFGSNNNSVNDLNHADTKNGSNNSLPTMRIQADSNVEMKKRAEMKKQNGPVGILI